MCEKSHEIFGFTHVKMGLDLEICSNKFSLIPKRSNPHWTSYFFEDYMKKTLIALAALAAFGSASAEVTLYGKLDAGISVKTSDAVGAVNQGAQIGSGNYESSRIGVKGSSEVAPGLKAVFAIEGGLGATDGAFTSFNRNAFLGLTGDFGTVTAGKQWTPYDNAFNDALEYNGFSAMGSAFYGGFHGDNGNDGSGAAKNAIQYMTPTMGGFNAVVMYAPNADATATQGSTNYTGFGVNYASGPLTVNLATEKVLTTLHNGVGSATSNAYTTAWILATSYNLGMATLFAAAESATAESGLGLSGKDTGYSLGVSIPVSKAATVGLGYATETNSVSGATASDGKTTSMGVQVVYALNAATAVYAGYNKGTKTPLGGGADVGTSKFATGVRYNF
jgi:predicted porin